MVFVKFIRKEVVAMISRRSSGILVGPGKLVPSTHKTKLMRGFCARFITRILRTRET